MFGYEGVCLCVCVCVCLRMHTCMWVCICVSVRAFLCVHAGKVCVNVQIARSLLPFTPVTSSRKCWSEGCDDTFSLSSLLQWGCW